jgi:hypothetical protein
MTIHWKALEEHFLVVPLVFQSTILRGIWKSAFSEFFSKNDGLYMFKELSTKC